MTSRRRVDDSLSSPVRSPKKETTRFVPGTMGAQWETSESLDMSRPNSIPHGPTVPDEGTLYLSCDRGILNSAVQPRESTRAATSHTASQFESSLESSK